MYSIIITSAYLYKLIIKIIISISSFNVRKVLMRIRNQNMVLTYIFAL